MNGNLAPESLSDLVGMFYDCIPDATLWQQALTRITAVCDGHLGTLAVVDTELNIPRFSVSCGDEKVLRPLLANYAKDMPFYAAVSKMELDVPLTIDAIYALQGPQTRDVWLNSKMAREWAVPNNIDDCFWLPVMKQPGRVGNLIVITHKDRPQITTEDMHLVSTLSPHIRRAVAIGDLFESERRKGEIFRDVVDQLSHPVLIVSEDMHIVFANLAAEKLLQSKDIVYSLRGHLSFSFRYANTAIAHAVTAGKRDEYMLGPVGINVPMSNAAAPSVAHVLPLARRDPSQRISQRAAAAIFIASAGQAPLPAMDAIAALFGLTAAEKRVVRHVADGKSRQDIAQECGVSDGTVKSQLSAIYDKTNTSDQRHLALLVRELTPPVKG
jgi:DNA-binding CsgD family transcriptional regulator/PAS domain-containing protein